MAKIIMLDADGFQHNTTPAVVLMPVQRCDIETHTTGSVLERLMVLTDTRENVDLYQESLIFQVEGYDDDPRELCEVPEVRAFFGAITREWPFCIWFLAREHGVLAFYFSLLCKTEVLRDPQGASAGFCIGDPTEIADVLVSLIQKSDPVLAAMGVTVDALTSSLNSAVSEMLNS